MCNQEGRAYKLDRLRRYALHLFGIADGKLAAVRTHGCEHFVAATLQLFNASFDAVLFLDDNRTMPTISAFAHGNASSLGLPRPRANRARRLPRGILSRRGAKKVWETPEIRALAIEVNACSQATYLALRARYGWPPPSDK